LTNNSSYRDYIRYSGLAQGLKRPHPNLRCDRDEAKKKKLFTESSPVETKNDVAEKEASNDNGSCSSIPQTKTQDPVRHQEEVQLEGEEEEVLYCHNCDPPTRLTLDEVGQHVLDFDGHHDFREA